MQGCELLLSKDKMSVLFFINGSGIIADNDKSVEYKAGDTILIPADYEGVVKFAQETKYLIITID
jgi:mannose-6-phosphate isomerase-like protein (cupin superfamily)